MLISPAILPFFRTNNAKMQGKPSIPTYPIDMMHHANPAAQRTSTP